MAHMIMEHDGLVLTGQPAWHGLGIVVESAPTAREALRIAKIDWPIRQLPIQAIGVGPLDGATFQAPGYVANLREDTGEVLAVVGEGYAVLQNADLAEVIDGLAASEHRVAIESAGSLRNGRDVFFCAKLGSFGVGIGGGDEVREYALFANTHDGSRAFRLLPTSVRVVCNNTLTMALRGGHREGFAIRHTASLNRRVEDAAAAVLQAREYSAQFRTAVEALAKRMLQDRERQAYWRSVYESTIGKIPEKPTNDAEERRVRHSVATLEAWQAAANDPKQRVAGIEGSAWSALQALTQWADHDRTVRTAKSSPTKSDARIVSNLFGTSAQFKAVALDKAVALLA